MIAEHHVWIVLTSYVNEVNAVVTAPTLAFTTKTKADAAADTMNKGGKVSASVIGLPLH